MNMKHSKYLNLNKLAITAVLGTVLLIGLFNWIHIPKPTNGDCSVENHTFAVWFVKSIYLASTHLLLTLVGLGVAYVLVFFVSTFAIKISANAINDIKLLRAGRSRKSKASHARMVDNSVQVIKLTSDKRLRNFWIGAKLTSVGFFCAPALRIIVGVLIGGIISGYFNTYFNQVLCVVNSTSSGYREAQIAALVIGVAVCVALFAVHLKIPKNLYERYELHESRTRDLVTVWDVLEHDVLVAHATSYPRQVNVAILAAFKQAGFELFKSPVEVSDYGITKYGVRHTAGDAEYTTGDVAAVTAVTAVTELLVTFFDSGKDVVVNTCQPNLAFEFSMNAGLDPHDGIMLKFEPQFDTSLSVLRESIQRETVRVLECMLEISAAHATWQSQKAQSLQNQQEALDA